MYRKLVIIFLVFTIFLISDLLYAQKTSKVSEKSTAKKEKIVVKGPKARFEKDFTLFIGDQDRRPTAIHKSNYIEADVIKFFSAKNYVIAQTNVIFKNDEKKVNINSEYLEFYGDTGNAVFTGNPRMYISNENMYTGGDKVYMNVNEDVVNIEKNAFITNENIRAYSDKVEYVSKNNLAKMFGNVKVFSSNINLSSDIAFVTIISNEISNYVAFGNVVSETKNLTGRSEYLISFFKPTNSIDRYTMITNVVVDGKDVYVEAFKLEAKVSNIYENGMTNNLTFYTFYGNGNKRVFYVNKKEDTQLECDILDAVFDENNELVSSTARGKVKVIR